jgi:hypothetical protein
MTDKAAFQASVRTALIEYGKESTKTLATLNGGAIIAILALAGQYTKSPAVMHSLAGPLPIFLFGLVAAAISTFSTYLSFFAIDADWPVCVRWLSTGFAWVTVVASLIFFICGCWQIQSALIGLP